MAPYLLAEEKDLIPLPDELTYVDGAQVACGFGTVYEALEKITIGGDDTVLIVGLGPVGLAALQLARAMGADKLIGVEYDAERLKIAQDLHLADYVFQSNEETLGKLTIRKTGEALTVDCSANDQGRQLAIRATKSYGKIAFVGEGNTCTFQPSPDIIHGQKTIYGSWVTSLWRMEDLVDKLVRWNIHPEDLVTDRFSLERAGDAYALMAGGKCGKVAVVFDEKAE